MTSKYHHKLGNAYEAYWFIYYHPKFMLRERYPITAAEANEMEDKGYIVTHDLGGQDYREMRHCMSHALDHALDIHYTMTDRPDGGGRTDRGERKYVAVWLEFGTQYYGYAYSGTDEPAGPHDTQTMKHVSHDPDLDTGGATFDQALVRLARLIRRKYGDYKPKNGRQGACGRPCPDCREAKKNLTNVKN